MDVSRRSLLASLMAGLVLDPERLLWVPGQRRIFIPQRNYVTAWTVFDTRPDPIGSVFHVPLWKRNVEVIAIDNDGWGMQLMLTRKPTTKKKGYFGLGREAISTFEHCVAQQKRRDQQQASLYQEKGIICRS